MRGPARGSALATTLGALALALASCGDEEDADAGASPATVVPPGVPLYVEAVIRPEGDQREEVETALSTLLGTETPGELIVEQLDRTLAEEEAGLSWAEDIEPWLGERAGLFLEDFGAPDDRGAGTAGGEAQGAFVIQTTDPEAARTAVDEASAASEQPSEERSYDGVDYLSETDANPDAVGIVEDYVVFGSEDGLRSVVDAVSGESLADDGELPDDFGEGEPLVALYADPAPAIDALVAAGQLPASQRETLEGQLGFDPRAPVLGSVDATAEAFSAELSGDASASAAALGESELLAGLPAESWLAFGAADYGEALTQTIEAIEERVAASPAAPLGLGPGGLERSFSRELGLDLREDVLAWIGDVAFYGRGTSIFGLNLAAIVETTDEQASARALEALRTALEREPQVAVAPLSLEGEGFELSVPGAPVQILVVQRDGKVVAGLGEDSVAEALEPPETLGESESFEAAAAALGEDWSATFFIDPQPLLELIEGTGQATTDPGYQQAKPYLDAIDYAVFGARGDDRAGFRVVLGVREAESASAAAAALVP